MTLIFLILLAFLVYYLFINNQSNKTITYGLNDKKCPNCHNPIEADFNVCPVCKETLRKKCKSCDEMINVTWKYCPYCEVTLDENYTE